MTSQRLIEYDADVFSEIKLERYPSISLLGTYVLHQLLRLILTLIYKYIVDRLCIQLLKFAYAVLHTVSL